MKRGELKRDFDDAVHIGWSHATQIAREAHHVHSVITQLRTNPYVIPVVIFHGVEYLVDKLDEHLSENNVTITEPPSVDNYLLTGDLAGEDFYDMG